MLHIVLVGQLIRGLEDPYSRWLTYTAARWHWLSAGSSAGAVEWGAQFFILWAFSRGCWLVAEFQEQETQKNQEQGIAFYGLMSEVIKHHFCYNHSLPRVKRREHSSPLNRRCFEATHQKACEMDSTVAFLKSATCHTICVHSFIHSFIQ